MDGDTDFLWMAKRFSSRDVATCVNLGTVQIKGLQDLDWWIHGCQTHNQQLIATEFGKVTKRAEMTGERIDKERAEIYIKVSGLGKFKAEDFEAAKDGFNNLLSYKLGTTKADLRYVIRNSIVLEVFPYVAMGRMY